VLAKLEERGVTVIRVVIADDHPHVRSALRHVLELEDDFTVVGEAEDGSQAVEQVVTSRPDLVILDYRMPLLNGVQVAQEITRQAPDTAMVMLTSEDDPRVRAEAANAGVARYLLKTGRADELVRTLRAAAVGEGEPISVIVKPEAQPGEEKTLPPHRIA
jgi:DNA-binding NarL/FixJ family response regulator